MPNGYDAIIVDTMWKYGLTLTEALYKELQSNNVDTSSVFDIVDFLEEKLEDLDKVQYYMQVYTGQQPDIILRKLDDGTAGTRS